MSSLERKFLLAEIAEIAETVIIIIILSCVYVRQMSLDEEIKYLRNRVEQLELSKSSCNNEFKWRD